MNTLNTCRVCVVGDRGVGKTALIRKFLDDYKEDQYRATYAYSAKYAKTVHVDDKTVRFLIEETRIPEEVKDLGHFDVVMLCFNILSPSSLHSLYLSWSPVIPVSAQIILVGCQADLRSDKLSVAALAREGKHQVSSNLALSFSRQLEAVMYVETETRLSSMSSRAAFELAAKTMGQFSRQSSIMSSSSSITSPLIKSRSRSTSRNISNTSKLGGSEFWSRLRSPSVARRSRMSPIMDQENQQQKNSYRSKSLSRVGLGLSVALSPSSTSLSSRRFGQEINKDPNYDKLVKIKCLRIKEDRSKEEIEIEVPEAVFENLEDNCSHSSKAISKKRSTKILSYFGK